MAVQIKTIANLYRELTKLIPEGWACSPHQRSYCRAGAGKDIRHHHGPYGKHQETSYYGSLSWADPPDGQGRLWVYGNGKTPAAAYRATVENLRKVLSQRSQLAQLTAKPDAPRLNQAVKCLEYQS